MLKTNNILGFIAITREQTKSKRGYQWLGY
jgi:hypothetical protein